MVQNSPRNAACSSPCGIQFGIVPEMNAHPTITWHRLPWPSLNASMNYLTRFASAALSIALIVSVDTGKPRSNAGHTITPPSAPLTDFSASVRSARVELPSYLSLGTIANGFHAMATLNLLSCRFKNSIQQTRCKLLSPLLDAPATSSSMTTEPGPLSKMNTVAYFHIGRLRCIVPVNSLATRIYWRWIRFSFTSHRPLMHALWATR
jgi:hypothetical protein